MDNLLVKIRESYCELGEKDKNVADFILSNENEIPRMTISQIAQGSRVSQAAVVRFCKLFGSEGFKDFRRRLTTDILEQAMNPQPASSYITADLEGNEKLEDIVDRITAHNMRSISETKNLLDHEALEKAIAMLTDAPRIDFLGSGASGIVAMDAHQKFIRIGKTCNTSQDSHIQMTLVSSLRPKDVAVVISYSGKTKDALENAAVAKERGAYVIALTKYGSDNPLAKLGDIVLYTTSSETAYRSSATSSRITQLTLIDILFYGTLSRSMDTYQKNLENTYKYAAKKRLP
ncbi:MAG: MurR/RpiR family transcriptional regulator [Clostridia bacterium]|nr:MurR/RpiR family transcriptional regulator [Clostridia bacterium]